MKRDSANEQANGLIDDEIDFVDDMLFNNED